MRVEYHPAASEDLNNAVRFYNKRRPGLGYDLRTEVHIAINLILESPLRYKQNDRGFAAGCTTLPLFRHIQNA